MMDRVTRTIELHRELMALWGIENVYHLNLSLFPGADAYRELDMPESQGGVDGDIFIKRITVRGERNDHTSFTVYAPDAKYGNG